MGKKRQHEEEEGELELSHSAGKQPQSDSDSSNSNSDNEANSSDAEGSSGDEKDLVDIDFEFFDPKPIDFHAMKRMLISSFGDDAEDFNISELVDLILGQNTIGSTVKVDGDDDPYAFLTVLNMNTHKDKQAIKQIKSYLLKKAEKARVSGRLSEILDNEEKDVGLLLNERVVNMPPQVVAPMLKMLMEELEWAVEDKEPYKFEYYLLMAPMYKDVAAVDEDDEDDEAGSSRNYRARKQGKDAAGSIDAFLHAEDEFVEEFAQLKFDYKFSRSKRVAESRNSFADTGIAPSRRCLVIHKSKIRPLIDRLESALAP